MTHKNATRRLAWAACLLIPVLAGCSGADSATTGARSAAEARSEAPEAQSNANTSSPGPKRRPYRVVCTVGMVKDILSVVAGDQAEVVGLMGEGVDPHLYKPTRNDVKQLMEADIVFYCGLMLEGRMTDVFTQTARRGVPVFAVAEGIPDEELREPPEFQGHYDPHIWMDVSLWSRAVEFVGERLAEFDPEHADEYRSRAADYRSKLTRLDDYIREVIASIPEPQRILVTAHDAFGYFSRAYDIPVRSVQGITTESEAGVDDIVRLVDFIVERKLPAIFVESSVNPKTIEAIIAGAKERGVEVRIGGTLFSDAMGPAGTYEGTYIGMLDHNATTIVRALGGTAPERGLNGKLAAAQP